MAGPISHVVYAKLALQSFLDVADKKRFIIGTLFPDIRYLGHINRHATHATDVKLADVRAESDSFKAGMLFHALVDETRHAFVTNHHAYSILSKSRFTTIALKMCEDKQLHSKIKNWQHYTKILDAIDDEERIFRISDDIIRSWHNLNVGFLLDPNPTHDVKFLHAIGFDEHQIKETVSYIKEATKLGIVDMYLADYYDNFESILKKA